MRSLSQLLRNLSPPLTILSGAVAGAGNLSLLTWNAMIKELPNSNNKFHPFLYFHYMLDSGFRPNTHTFIYLIKVLASWPLVSEAKMVHTCAFKLGFQCSQFVSCALIGLYPVAGHVESARQLFDEIPQPGLVLWTTMIQGYVGVNCPIEALALFHEMRARGVDLDSVAMVTVITACAKLGDLCVAKKLHGIISKSGVEVDVFVNSGLLSMYGECGSLELAHQVFHEMDVRNVVAWNVMIHQCQKHDDLDCAHRLFMEMPGRDVVSWNTMVTGFLHAGHCRDALALFHQMESLDVKPNNVTLSGVLSACASLGALDAGTWIHTYIEKNNMNLDGSLNHCLIDMYSKCGSIEKALQLFEKTTSRDLFAWTSIICGLAMHGLAKRALFFFTQMLNAGIQPDDVTMVGVLNACAHAGLLDEGCHYFYSMETYYNLTPKIEHFGCMIDLFGRMGRLREASDLVNKMPMKPNVVVWGALLSACRVHNDVQLGQVAAERLLELDPSDQWARIMMSKMHAEAGEWDMVMGLRREIKQTGVKKTPGCSLIEVNGTVHEFLVGDDLHPQHEDIYGMLEKIDAQLKEL